MASPVEKKPDLEPFLPNSSTEDECDCPKDKWLVFAIEGLTIIFTLCIAVASGISFSESTTNSVLVFVLEMIIDIFSASVVIWRFCPKDEKVGHDREELGQIFLGIIEIMMAVAGITRCTYALSTSDDDHLHETEEHRNHALIIFGVATGGFVLLTIGKLILGYHFNSLTLVADAVDSATGGAMAFAVVVSQLVSAEHNAKLWYFDHLIGLLMACAVGIFALGLLYNRRDRLCANVDTCSCMCTKTKDRKK